MLRLRAAALLCGLLAVSVSAAEYDITDLGAGVSPRAISKTGMVVGSNHNHPFVWQNGILTDILPAGYWGGQASDVDSSGNVVGVLYGVNSSVAFRWSNGVLQTYTVGVMGSNFSAINDAGVMGGSAMRSFPTGSGVHMFDPFVLDNGAVTWLQELIGGGQPSAISATGLVVGTVATALMPPDRFQLAPAAWRNGALAVLPLLGGPGYSAANDVNASDVIVGIAPKPGADGLPEYMPVKWVNGNVYELGSLGGTSGGAYGINSSGQIVGYSSAAGYTDLRGFIYENGVMTDLNSAIDPAAGWTITSATAINDDGVIVAYGRQPGETAQHALVLTPADAATLLEHLQNALAAAGLDQGIANSLSSKIAAAQDSYARGSLAAACNQLAACQNDVEAQSGKKIPVAIATQLLQRISRIRTILGC